MTGTDTQLATATAKLRPIVWVDPPISIVSRIRRHIDVPHVSEVAPGVTRIHTTAPPGVTRAGVRNWSRWWSRRAAERHLRSAGLRVAAVISSSPEPVLAAWASSEAPRIYFATDDFVMGAEIAGHVKASRPGCQEPKFAERGCRPGRFTTAGRVTGQCALPSTPISQRV